MGMTDKQFQAMLYDELENWERVKELAEKEDAPETAAMAQTQIDKINLKLKA
ncbi:MAG: hypothetical protein IJT94_15710 [Oscillibacter sp.]|nr:hypothetical protein [Oscillibacter sp.]